MTDVTVLHDAALSLAATLQVGADDADWDVTVQISAGEPSYDCDAIYVWVGQIVPEIGAGGCVVASKVQFRYAIAECVGTDRDETVIFTGSSDHHDKVWAVWVALIEACCPSPGTLLGDQADTVRLSTLNLLTNSGGETIWSGTVEGVLSPLP